MSAEASMSDETNTARIRRAARACERCRSSKLRCQPPPAAASDSRCVHCAKMDYPCHFTSVQSVDGHSGPRKSKEPSYERDGAERLARLEDVVGKLLGALETRLDPVLSTASGVSKTAALSAGSMELFQQNVSPEHTSMNPSGTIHASRKRTVSHSGAIQPSWLRDAETGPSSASIHPATFSSADAPLSLGDNGLIADTQVEYDAIQQLLNFDSSMPGFLAAQMPYGHAQPMPKPAVTHISSSRSMDRNGSKTNHDADLDPAQARPIPKLAPGGRMAAFRDPTSHEAPFRSLTYNPDTFRNVELPEERDEEVVQRSTSLRTINQDGSKTPKRGRGDPIDKGVLEEAEARQLFTFYRERISLFLPILSEQDTFETVRHHSSFLLTSLLAVASKYCCATTYAHTSPEAFSSASIGSSFQRDGPIIEEDKWMRIRALAMWNYFQCIISKVHCLEDVQAIIVLAAWGLQDRGASPDPWLMTGSAYRLARRLGIHLTAAGLASGTAIINGRTIASWRTYLCLYALDRCLTIGFGRPETEGFPPETINTDVFRSLASVQPPVASNDLSLWCSPESAASISAYVDLANIARRYSLLVNETLKRDPTTLASGIAGISAGLEEMFGRWLSARSSLAAKLGPASRITRVLYDHMRLCLHSIPLKPMSHPDSALFLQRTGLQSTSGKVVLATCLRKAEEAAIRIIQTFADDLHEDQNTLFCYSYDYLYMVIAHAAAALLNLATLHSNGIPEASPETAEIFTGRGRKSGVDKATAWKFCGIAISAMMDSNRSANLFPCDMAVNLSMIAKETGMDVAEWTSESAAKMLEARMSAANADLNSKVAAFTDSNGQSSAVDFSMFPDLDMFFQQDPFEDLAFFQ